MLDQQRKEAQAEKNQQKLDEINQKKIDFKKEAALAEANQSKEEWNESKTIREAIVKAEKAASDIEESRAKTAKYKAEAKAEGRPSTKGAAFVSPLKQGLSTIAAQYGYTVDKDSKLQFIGQGKPLSQNSPAYKEMLRRQQKYQKLFTDKLQELGGTTKNNQLQAMAYADRELAKDTGEFSVMSISKGSKKPASIADLKKDPKFQAGITQIRTLKGKTKQDAIKELAKIYNLKPIDIANLLK